MLSANPWWSSGSMHAWLQCARSWDRIALCLWAVVFIVKTTAIYSHGHGLCASFLHYLGQLSLLPLWDDSCPTGGLTAQVRWLGLRVGGRLALLYNHQMNRVNSRNELGHYDNTINIIMDIIILIINAHPTPDFIMRITAKRQSYLPRSKKQLIQIIPSKSVNNKQTNKRKK